MAGEPRGTNGNDRRGGRNARQTGPSGEERPRESRQDRKHRLINEDRAWDVVRAKTPDTATCVNLLNTCDEFMFRLRMQDFEKGNLTYTDLQEFIRRHNDIKESINTLNIELAKALGGLDYRPPRGFSKKLPSATASSQNPEEATPLVESAMEAPTASAASA